MFRIGYNTNMPAVIPQNVEGARQGVTDAGNVLSQYAGKQYTIGDELKKVLDEATLPGKTDWSNITATTMADYLNSKDEAYAKYRSPESENYIFDPAKSRQTMNEYSRGSQIPFLASSQLFGLMVKGEKDIVDAGTRAFQAKQAAAQTAYEVARNIYSDLLDEFKLTETLRQGDEELAIKKMSAQNSGGGKKNNHITAMVDGDKVLYDLDTQQVVTDAKGNPVVIEEGQPPEPTKKDLVNIGESAYTFDPASATLTPLTVPGQNKSVNSRWFPDNPWGIAPFGTQ